jgi:hypothetical protein
MWGRTGSLYSSLARSTSRIVLAGACARSPPIVCFADPEAICLNPSSNHASISVRRAASPFPKSAVMAESERGSISGCAVEVEGRETTEHARASRVNPCVLIRGRASLRRCELRLKRLVSSGRKMRCFEDEMYLEYAAIVVCVDEKGIRTPI